MEATEFPDWFLDITKKDTCGVCYDVVTTSMPNSCNANFYPEAYSAVGWHSDDERLFKTDSGDCLIVSLSLGASREFQIRTAKGKKFIVGIRLNHGDLLTMEGQFQSMYEHRIPKEHSVTGSRINLTWRWIVTHEQGCGE